jgi:hypothetical protein
MNETAPSRFQILLPYAALLLTLAAYSAGAPAKLAHHRVALPLLLESDFRDEPMLYTLQPETRSWRRFNEMNFRSMIALK